MKPSRWSPFQSAAFVAFIRFVWVFLAALATTPAQAQAQARFFPPVRLDVPEAEKPIELRQLDIKVDIEGRLARTTVAMTFYNPNDRVLEGELHFPLLEGQTIVGFALSMDDGTGKETMRDAVPVDKVKGRQVFEDVIRQRIDPALLEATQGNNFKLRVYPLNAGRTRRVRLVYDEHIGAEPGGDALYRLPLAYAARVQRLNIEVETTGASRPPVISGQVAGLGLAFRKNAKNKYAAKAETANARLQGSSALRVTIPVQKDEVHVGARNGKKYFYAEVDAPAATARTTPKTVDLLWDASASGRRRDHAREFAFLAALFARLPEVSVRLQVVRDVAEKPSQFKVIRGNWSKLKKALEAIVYDGATQLSAFDFKTSTDIYLLFSDGLDNYSVAPVVAPAAPLFALVATPGAETNRLRGLAANGGAVIDLDSGDAKMMVERVMQKRSHIVTVEGGVTDVVWQESPQGDTFLVAGIVQDAARPLRIVFVDGSANERRISGKDATADAVPHLWAAFKIARLEEEYDLNRGEIRRIGRTFGIPTRETSLIVLDRVADYVTHDIEPPPELKDEYDRLSAQPRRGNGEPDKLGRVLAEWEARKEWWKTKYPQGKMPDEQRELNKKVRALDAVIMGLGAAAPPPAKDAATLQESVTMDDMVVDDDAVPLAMSPVNELKRAIETKIRKNPRRPGASATAKKPALPPVHAGIALRPWSPDSTYIRRMKEAKNEDLYRIYLDERPDFENSVAFYLDMSYELGRRGQNALALRVLSNLAEMDFENRQILRVLGYRLLEANLSKHAVLIFRRVLALADDEPQSFRDLGLAHEAAGEHQKAIDRLYDVVEKNFARQFPGIEVIALTELNAIVATAPKRLNTRRIDPRFLASQPLDLRVVLTWDSDNTDIDLHVIDPNGDEAYYSRPLSYQGGAISQDNTVGYGPEEYALRKAKPGKYRVEVHFYGHLQQMISEATTIQLDFFTGYGKRNGKKQSVTMRLKERKEKILVGEFDVK